MTVLGLYYKSNQEKTTLGTIYYNSYKSSTRAAQEARLQDSWLRMLSA